MSERAERSVSRVATIHDVAELAGVATSTVSRALSTPDRVSPATRQRILAAAARLNYVPNSQARALSSGRTNAVAVLVPDITNPFYFGIIRGAQMQLKAVGYTQLLVDTEESAEVEATAIDSLRRSADGIVFAAPRLNDQQLIDVAAGFPVVAINREVEGVASVVIDTPSGITHALEHLVAYGHRRIGYVAGPQGSWSSRRRWDALTDRAAGISDVEVVPIGDFPPKTTSGAGAAEAALNAGVTACVAFNDLIAIGMLQHLVRRGVAVPGEMSVVGCDDIFGANFCHPPLTTLTAPIEDAGRVATRMLLNGLGVDRGSWPSTSRTLPTHLTVRASTGPVPADRR